MTHNSDGGRSSFSGISNPDESHSLHTTAYFKSRAEMGRKLAPQLSSLRGSNVAILALSPGGGLMGVEIAKQLHAPVGLLLLKDIYLPDKRTIVGVINNSGHFTRDVSISKPQMEDFEMEYRNALARSKSSAVTELHKLGRHDLVRPEFYKDKIVVLVHDVTSSGTVFRAGIDFLRSVRVDAHIFVSGVAKYEAQYYMQEHGDALIVEHLTDKNLPPSHYFDDESTLESNEIVKKLMESVILHF